MYQQAVDNADVEVDLDLAICGWPSTSCCVSVMKPAKGGWLD